MTRKKGKGKDKSKGKQQVLRFAQDDNKKGKGEG